MERPMLGQLCVIHAIARREKTPIYTKNGVSRGVSWDEFNSESPDLDCITSNIRATAIDPITAIYTGYRSLVYGATDIKREMVSYAEYGGREIEEREPIWHADGHVDVWLFVKNERSNPVYVFPVDVLVIKEAQS